MKDMSNKFPLQYRDFNTLTDKEIEFICKEILGMKKVVDIERYDDEIEVYGISEWTDDETGETVKAEDTIALTPSKIMGYSFSISSKESKNYSKYLFSLGMDWRLKDNPYLQ